MRCGTVNQIFFKVKFEDKDEIDYNMFREINEIIAKIRFEGYGKILAPRYEYYDSDKYIVNELGNKMYITLYLLHDDKDGHKLRNHLITEINGLGYNYSYELEMPNFIEIFYNSSFLDNPIKFESEFKTKIKECDGIIKEYGGVKANYDSTIKFRLECPMYNFDEKINEILNFLKNNSIDEFFIEYF